MALSLLGVTAQCTESERLPTARDHGLVLRKVVHAESGFIAVGTRPDPDGCEGCTLAALLTSAQGDQWLLRDTGLAGGFVGVANTNTGPILVGSHQAPGDGGSETFFASRYTDDGTLAPIQKLVLAGRPMDIAYGAKTIAIAVDRDGIDTAVQVSRDGGLTWEVFPVGHHWEELEMRYEHGQFVIFGSRRVIAVSTDASSWELASLGERQIIRVDHLSLHDNRCYAVATVRESFGFQRHSYTSEDCRVWTIDDMNGLVLANDLSSSENHHTVAGPGGIYQISGSIEADEWQRPKQDLDVEQELFSIAQLDRTVVVVGIEALAVQWRAGGEFVNVGILAE